MLFVQHECGFCFSTSINQHLGAGLHVRPNPLGSNFSCDPRVRTGTEVRPYIIIIHVSSSQPFMLLGYQTCLSLQGTVDGWG